MSKLYKMMSFKLKEVDEDKAIISGVFSTENEDRHGDVVKQKWDLKNFKANPVILNSHNYNDATEVIGKATSIGMKEGALQGKIQFAVKENPKAQVIYDLYAGGFLNAFSVGFIPKEFSQDYKEILKSELLEISAVSVPANAMALAKAKGINIEKLYETNEKCCGEQPDEENVEDEGDDENTTEEIDNSKDSGRESEPIIYPVKEETPTGNETEEVEEIKEEVVEEVVEENKKAKTLKKLASVIDQICEANKGRNSEQSDKAEINKSINRAIRKLLTIKE